jgi:hypothetical protein
MKSILPPELDSKRLAIARKHNRLVLALGLGVFGFIFAALFLTRHDLVRATVRVTLILVIAIAGEAYGIYRIFEYDKELCRQLGFMCPHCHQPLYEPRSFINVNAKCPKCHKSILS